MKEFEIIKEEVSKRIPKLVKCNKCGKSQELHGNEDEREWQTNLFQRIVCSFGYGSKFDMDNWEFDLCEKCLIDIIRTFEKLPDGYDEEYINKIYDEL